jgi:hypothetical protein
VVGEQAAWQVADVQFERTLQRRRTGDAVGAALAVLEQEFDVLAGAVGQRFVGRQLQRNDGDVRRGPLAGVPLA